MAQCLGDFQKIWFEHGPVIVSNDESYLMTNYTMTSASIPFIHQLIFKQPQPSKGKQYNGIHSDLAQVFLTFQNLLASHVCGRIGDDDVLCGN